MSRLIGLSYSPWTIKARWALDHHRVPYAFSEYLPMLGEPALRLRARRLGGRVTVPIFFDDSGTYGDSWVIAQHAEEVGQGAPLMPDVEAVGRWNDRAEVLSAAGRARATPRVGADPEARRENVPPAIPKALRGVATPLVDVGTRFLTRKYRLGERSTEELEAEIESVLGEAQRDLATRPYLLGDFSYADVALAVALQFVKPVGEGQIRLGPATRRCFTLDALAAEYGDVLAWRDRVFAEHRPRRAP